LSNFQIKHRKNSELGFGSNSLLLPIARAYSGYWFREWEHHPPYIVTDRSLTLPSDAAVRADPKPNPIQFDKAENFVLAAAHARKLGHPLDYHLTITWPDYDDTGGAHENLRRRLQDWLEYQIGIAAFVWVKETSTHDHSHFLLSLNSSKTAKCRKMVCKWIKAFEDLEHLPSNTVSLTQIDRRVDPDKQIRNRVRYLLKGAELYARYFFDCRISPDGGATAGKRIGWSQALGHAARQREGGVIASGLKSVSQGMLDVAATRYGSIKLKSGMIMIGCCRRKRKSYA
jgi:hypothetical protein